MTRIDSSYLAREYITRELVTRGLSRELAASMADRVTVVSVGESVVVEHDGSRITLDEREKVHAMFARLTAAGADEALKRSGYDPIEHGKQIAAQQKEQQGNPDLAFS